MVQLNSEVAMTYIPSSDAAVYKVRGFIYALIFIVRLFCGLESEEAIEKKKSWTRGKMRASGSSLSSHARSQKNKRKGPGLPFGIMHSQNRIIMKEEKEKKK